jgi:hypothetical protein
MTGMAVGIFGVPRIRAIVSMLGSQTWNDQERRKNQGYALGGHEWENPGADVLCW